MTTAAKGFRYEFKRKLISTGTVSANTLLLSVPMGSNYFIFVNHVYRLQSGSLSANLDISINKDFMTATSFLTTLNSTITFERREFSMTSDSAPDRARLVLAGERLYTPNGDLSAGDKYIEYTEVYFGGLSASI